MCIRDRYGRITELGYKIDLTPEAKDFIADHGYDHNYGARPLKRAIQKYLEDPLAEEIIKAELSEGDTIKVALDKEKAELVISVLKASGTPPASPPTKSGSGGRKKKSDQDQE